MCQNLMHSVTVSLTNPSGRTQLTEAKLFVRFCIALGFEEEDSLEKLLSVLFGVQKRSIHPFVCFFKSSLFSERRQSTLFQIFFSIYTDKLAINLVLIFAITLYTQYKKLSKTHNVFDLHIHCMSSKKMTQHFVSTVKLTRNVLVCLQRRATRPKISYNIDKENKSAS